MRKLLATIISLFCSNRMRRHAVRYAIKNRQYFARLAQSQKLVKNEKIFRATNDNTRNFLAICAIMKNEAQYLLEWIEYHKLVGVEKFYLYDNESDDDTKKILMPYIKSGIVEYTFQPGQKQQKIAYEDCISKHKFDTDWIAFIDLDEYIVPVKTETVADFLKGVSPQVTEIIANWVVYGSSGHEKKPKGLVLENYLWRAKKSWLYKSIVNPRMILTGLGCHEHDVAGKILHLSTNEMRINHYHCKSWEEYQKRALRGDAWDGKTAGQNKYQRETFNRHDKNEMYDDIMLKYVEKIKRIIRK